MRWDEVVAILLAALGSVGLWEFLRSWMERRSRRHVTDAEAHKLEAESQFTLAQAGERTLEGAFKLIKQLQDQVDGLGETVDAQGKKITRLQVTVNQYAARVTYLMSGIATLIKQIVDQGQDPCWKPGEWQPPDEHEEGDE